MNEKLKLLLKRELKPLAALSLILSYMTTALIGFSLQRFSLLLTYKKESLGLLRALFFPLSSFESFILMLLLAAIWLVALVNLYLRRDTEFESREELLENKLHSARCMTVEEVIDDMDLGYGSLETTRGIILGKMNGLVVTQKPEGGLNKNCLVVGMAGTGKTTAFIKPYVIRSIEEKESIVCIDTKGDIYSDTLAYALEKGYKVNVYNTRDPAFSDGFNILEGIDPKSQDLDRVVETVFNCLNPEGKGSDPYFRTGAFVLFKALTIYVLNEKAEYEAAGLLEEARESIPNLGTLSRVFDLLVKYEPGEGASKHLKKLFEAAFKENPDNPAIPVWNTFNTGIKDENLSALIQNLTLALSPLERKDIRRILGKNDIDIIKIGREPTIVYINISDQSITGNAIASIFLREITYRLAWEADNRREKRLKTPVTLLLDEFGAIGKIPAFDQFISVSRSRGIRCVIAFQNFSQIYNNYGNGASTILNNCNIWLSSGIHDLETAEIFSKTMGDTYIFRNTKSVSKNSVDKLTSYSQSDTILKKKLLEPSEVMKMKEGKMLVVVARREALILDQIRSYEMPQFIGRKHYNIMKYLEDKEKF